ncbi:MAG: hypothetical protein ACT4PP_00065 [Sporichthyaceae bacterium]
MDEMVVALHRALRDAELPYAFGGALALAWCVREPRATADIDLNIFVGVDQVERVLSALPPGMSPTVDQRALLERDAQARLRWERTPVDIFLVNTDFHAGVAVRCRHESFGGESIPYLSCPDLAVFKAFFNRDKDWTDLAAMALAGSIDRHALEATIVEFLGAQDSRVPRIRQLAGRPRP